MDALYLLLGMGFFLLSLGFASFSEKLLGQEE